MGDGQCQDEVDQVLPNARKNTRGSRNNAIKPSAGFNAKPEEPSGTSSDSSDLDLSELQKHAAEQAALFQMGADDGDISSIPRERSPEKTEP